MNNIKLHVERSPAMRNYQFWLIQRNQMSGKIYYGKTVEMIEAEDKGEYYPATFMLDEEEAQIFFDELWRDGHRPTEIKESGGAQSKHLEDMRRIAFQFLEGLKK